MGRAGPLAKGVGASHQCSRVNEQRSGFGGVVTGHGAASGTTKSALIEPLTATPSALQFAAWTSRAGIMMFCHLYSIGSTTMPARSRNPPQTQPPMIACVREREGGGWVGARVQVSIDGIQCEDGVQ